ncbi:MAG: heavy metal translocating P-type ATPase metal-binding domain-containing protein [Verrucomicrobiales bacterium]|nr:heavy metal translocating P-type ATPase metal-binding domain-containing protein [Verrucomicrobiales bacterium]
MAEALDPLRLAGAGTGGESVASAGWGAAVPATDAAREDLAPEPCRHCGEPCAGGGFRSGGHPFCCLGCQTVYSLLQEGGLTDFYRMGERPGRRASEAHAGRWAYLDDPAVARRLLDFEDGKLARVTFHIPSIHCVACVWLLEQLFRLHSGVGSSRVNFPRREVAITYAPGQIRLSELAALLDRVGYAPELTLAELDRAKPAPVRKLGLQIAVAGFAFGNVMLFSLPQYMGLDAYSGPRFRTLFGFLSLILTLPVLIFSASDYWRSAWASLRQRVLTLDVPIAAGLAALYAQSLWEVLSGHGEGYFDSLAGLVFFLLCGRAFQQKTHDRLGFDRDYRGFFPLAVVRRTAAGDESIAISKVQTGDRLVVRSGELIPADARLLAGDGCVDYSFVTGESDPVARAPGDHLYAGGRQVGGAIEVETVKPVSQSYLTSLWNDEAFRKNRDNTFETLTNRYSRRFTLAVVVISFGALAAWSLAGDPVRGLKAFTSVLIVACPCALALAAPFTLGTAQRLLARFGAFVRNGQVIETLARVDTLAFDKTGTLTAADSAGVRFDGAPLSPAQESRIAALCRQSTHPHARRLVRHLGAAGEGIPVTGFREVAGQGISAGVNGRLVVLGSRAWLAAGGVVISESPTPGSRVHVAEDGVYLGVMLLENRVRPNVDRLLVELGRNYELALLSGDHAHERERFAGWFGKSAALHFNQSPQEKLAFVRALQADGHCVAMVGDGLNDAGALRQGDVGVAVVEGVGKFSPASDVILDAARVTGLGRILDFSQRSVRIVRAGFLVSGSYNLIGVSIAAAGILSPLICAILMPLSSVTVVVFAMAATRLAASRSGLLSPASEAPRATSMPRS